MSIDFGFFFTLFFNTSSAVVLSVCIVVGGCLCPISSSECRARMAYLRFIYRAPISASDAEDITVLMICAIFEDDSIILFLRRVTGHEKVASRSAFSVCF